MIDHVGRIIVSCKSLSKAFDRRVLTTSQHRPIRIQYYSKLRISQQVDIAEVSSYAPHTYLIFGACSQLITALFLNVSRSLVLKTNFLNFKQVYIENIATSMMPNKYTMKKYIMTDLI